MDLIEGDTVAIDSFKIRASNSLKKNFNHNKLDRHLEYFDNQITQYEKGAGKAGPNGQKTDT